MAEKTYTTITIEIDNVLYRELCEICEKNNTTPELVAKGFIEFSANPENRGAVVEWYNKCCEEGLI